MLTTATIKSIKMQQSKKGDEYAYVTFTSGDVSYAYCWAKPLIEKLKEGLNANFAFQKREKKAKNKNNKSY